MTLEQAFKNFKGGNKRKYQHTMAYIKKNTYSYVRNLLKKSVH